MLPLLNVVEGNYSRFTCRMEALCRIHVISMGILTSLQCHLMKRRAANAESKTKSHKRVFVCIHIDEKH